MKHIFTIVAAIAALALLFFGGLAIVSLACFVVPAISGGLHEMK